MLPTPAAASGATRGRIGGVPSAATAPSGDLDARYRYVLERRWGAGPAVLWVLANPSSADAERDDPTVRRCVSFARRDGAGGLVLVNLRAWRDADPRRLADVPDPVGPGNDAAVLTALAATTGPVVVAWGVQRDAGRVRTVVDLLGDRPTLCLGTTRDGHPRHPLYVPGSTRLRPWAAR
jgi:hypothetical protein